jgi:hypothetical protein
MRKYLLLVLSVSILLSSPTPGQTGKAELDVAATAILFVHRQHAPGKLLLVPASDKEAMLANMVATRIGARATGKPCATDTICDPPPAEDVLAVTVEIVSIDDASAMVRVVTRGLNNPSTQPRPKQWVSTTDLSLVRSAKGWVVTRQSVLRT